MSRARDLANRTIASAALPKSGGAMTGAITTNSTFDGVDIAVRDALHAPKANPAFTGTPTGITAAHLEAGVLPSDVTGGSGLTALGQIATVTGWNQDSIFKNIGSFHMASGSTVDSVNVGPWEVDDTTYRYNVGGFSIGNTTGTTQANSEITITNGGIYFISFQLGIYRGANQTTLGLNPEGYLRFYISSSWVNTHGIYAMGYDTYNSYDTYIRGGCTGHGIFDVPDNQICRIDIGSYSTNVLYAENYNTVQFIQLSET